MLKLPELQAAIKEAGCSLMSCKEALAVGNERIYQAYNNDISAAALVLMQSSLTDAVLEEIWNAKFTPPDQQNVSLIAVGGYGRAELHPYSDIDISILVADIPDDGLNERLESFITFLWDLGLEIGHSVRSVAQCREEAVSDLTVITNLMEARHLFGSAALFEQMKAETAADQMWPSEEFFEGKLEEQRLRRKKYHSNAYRLEPNLKESNGGLRDIQTLFWICQRHFGARSFEDLVEQELLTPTEYDTLINGLNILWRIRYLLHRIAGRHEDRLLFDYQREIAHEWGFTDDTNNRSIEQLMQLFYRNAMNLQRLNDIILQGIGGLISGVTAATEAVPVNSRFQVRNGFLEVQHDQVFVNYPPALLEVFLLFGETPSADRFRANTVRLIREHLDLIDKAFREDMIVRNLFLQIFRSPQKLTRKIRLMNRYGVLAAYLPAFDLIVGRMQYDLFHIYTVDEHTIRVIRNLRRFALPEFGDELPHCTDVMSRVKDHELLYLAGLFHDIAKGRGGDHSELGAVDAKVFCELHGLGPADAGLVSWVVQKHLIMSTTAQRKDISDPEVIHEFASEVSSTKHLDHLYLLTIADIRATNPELWNSFKQNLLQDLYESTYRVLRQGLDNPLDKEDVLQQKKKEAQEILQADNIDIDSALELWSQFDEHYFLQHTEVEIARHASSILQHTDPETPLVTLRTARRRGSTELLIYLRDHANIFALTTAALDRQNLNILSANISTSTTGFALDTFHVLDDNDRIIREATRLDQIRNELTDVLCSPEVLPEPMSMRAPRKLKHFDITPRIEFDNATSTDVTSVYIDAADQPGVLSLIGQIFMRHGILVRAAKISTLGERIEDMFYVTDLQGRQLQDDQARTEFRIDLVNTLSTNNNHQDGNSK